MPSVKTTIYTKSFFVKIWHMFTCMNSNSVCAFIGFPRTKEQAEELFAKEPIDAALNLIVPFEVIIERVKGRWIHEKSGRIYNMEYSPPKVMVRNLPLQQSVL
jgi:adenylate kinase family enzyme